MQNQQSWLASPLGNYLTTQEQALYDQAVSNVFGFNAVQLGMLELDLLQQCRMPFSFRAGVRQGVVNCQSTQLPFVSASIDLILLPHVLEFSDDPHQTLREAERVLVPEGHIILSGFNPISAWGAKWALSRANEYPWHGHFLSLLRIKDWLALLGFEIVSLPMCCHALPFSNPAWLRRTHFIERLGQRWWPMMGGAYLIVARKKVLGMRVIRPDWKANRLKRLVSVPTQRQPTQNKQRNHACKKK